MLIISLWFVRVVVTNGGNKSGIHKVRSGIHKVRSGYFREHLQKIRAIDFLSNSGYEYC